MNARCDRTEWCVFVCFLDAPARWCLRRAAKGSISGYRLCRPRNSSASILAPLILCHQRDGADNPAQTMSNTGLNTGLAVRREHTCAVVV